MILQLEKSGQFGISRSYIFVGFFAFAFSSFLNSIYGLRGRDDGVRNAYKKPDLLGQKAINNLTSFTPRFVIAISDLDLRS